jgi:hypothetical protein
LFIGHFGVAFAAKRLVPRTSLVVLFLSAQLIDLLWPMFLLLGLEHVRVDPGNTVVTALDFYDYPITHSLAGAVAWAFGLASLVYALTHARRAALVSGALVMSHWFLDLTVHGPDLPLWPGGPEYGFGLWDSLAATAGLEVGVFAAGIFLYVRSTSTRGPRRHLALWSLAGFLLLVQAGNFFGPPPPGASAIAWVGMAQWLLIAWAGWADRARPQESRSQERIGPLAGHSPASAAKASVKNAG